MMRRSAGDEAPSLFLHDLGAASLQLKEAEHFFLACRTRVAKRIRAVLRAELNGAVFHAATLATAAASDALFSAPRNALVIDASHPINAALAALRDVRRREQILLRAGRAPGPVLIIVLGDCGDEKKLLDAGADVVVQGPRTNPEFLTAAVRCLLMSPRAPTAPPPSAPGRRSATPSTPLRSTRRPPLVQTSADDFSAHLVLDPSAKYVGAPHDRSAAASPAAPASELDGQFMLPTTAASARRPGLKTQPSERRKMRLRLQLPTEACSSRALTAPPFPSPIAAGDRQSAGDRTAARTTAGAVFVAPGVAFPSFATSFAPRLGSPSPRFSTPPPSPLASPELAYRTLRPRRPGSPRA